MTVPNFHPKVGENLQFIRSDGVVFNLNSPPSRGILNMTGWGKPDAEQQTVSGPYQHGNTVVSYRLKPRIITVDIVHTYKNRSKWHEGRVSLLNQMGFNNTSPDSPVPGVLRWSYIQNSTYITRDIDVFLQRGLGFSPLDSWREWGILESLEFLAPNPVIYDPAVKTATISTFVLELRFPVTFPFVLGTSAGTGSITYVGTWESFPTITITGPAAGVFIENTTTGKKIRFDYTVSLGETVTISLAYNSRSATNNLGLDLTSYISEDSDFSTFSLQPSPIVAGGTNNFSVDITGPTTGTSVILSYYNRYYGI